MSGTFVHGHGAAANQLPATLGQLVSASSLSVVIASDYTLPVTISTTAASPLFAELSDGAAGYVGAKTGQLPSALGQTTMAASLSVTVASNQSSLPVTVGNATLAVTQSGTWTVRNQDGVGNSLSSTGGALNVSAAQLPTTIGAKLSAASLSVVVASDSSVAATQSGTWTVTQSGTWTMQPGNTANSTPWLVTDSSDGPVTAGTVAGKSSLIGGQFNTALPTLTNGQQAALQADSSGRLLVGALATGANVIGGVTQSGTWNVGTVTAVTAITNALPAGANVIGAVTQSGTWAVTGLPTALGQKTMVNSTSVAIASDQSTLNVSVQNATLAVTQSGTWSARLNDGAGTSVTVGQKAMASSLPVTIASDQGAIGSITQTGIDYNAGLSGATTQRFVDAGRAKAWLARNDYSTTSVTTGAYVQLVASTGAATTRLRIFDSSGSAMILATGAAASEVDQLYIPPGGWDGPIELNIASGTRVSLKALDATANTGQIVITALS